MTVTARPDPNEIEVSVFGPGRGECIVIHLGNNEWCVVDSCIAKGNSRPIALQYLEGLGIDTIDGVKLIVATHWHDDHIRGLAKLLEECTSAQFSCSIALKSDQFQLMVAEEASLPLNASSGVKEFAAIFSLLLDRQRANMPKSHISPVLAGVNRRILHRTAPGRSFHASIMALSPSDGLFRRTLVNMQDWPSDDSQASRDQPQNETSVVLWIELGNRCVLLGADLETKPHAGAGWLGVVESFQGDRRARFYKVAHHGSPNGDCDAIWTKLLEDEPFAAVTPYNSSDLPAPDDLTRLKSRTPNLYITARPTGRLPKRSPIVEKELRRVNRRIVDLKPGHIRWRWKLNSYSPTVELFEGAEKVN
jgi:beta-lactamase superfamily II metal-dependent hydrolase